jgi:hypothetical protein
MAFRSLVCEKARVCVPWKLGSVGHPDHHTDILCVIINFLIWSVLGDVGYAMFSSPIPAFATPICRDLSEVRWTSGRGTVQARLSMLPQKDFCRVVIAGKKDEHFLSITYLNHVINHPIAPVAKYCQNRPRFSI